MKKQTFFLVICTILIFMLAGCKTNNTTSN